MILYEYPFNERLRTYLRLEQLFRRLGELIPRAHPLDHHYALVTMFEIMDVAARADLKSDVLKDIEKHKHQLDGYRGNPSISEAALDAVIVIDCPPSVQIQRVMSRSGLNRSTVEAILAAQSPRNIRRASADIVVHNGDNCTLADLQKMAEQVATRLGL